MNTLALVHEPSMLAGFGWIFLCTAAMGGAVFGGVEIFDRWRSSR